MFNRGFCTWWPDSLFGIDYSMSCWAHDQSYKKSIIEKIKGDIDLLLDVWAVSVVAKEKWKQILIKANAITMFLGVSTIGTFVWAFGKIK